MTIESHKGDDMMLWFFNRCYKSLHTSECLFAYLAKRTSFLKDYASFQLQNAQPWDYHNSVKATLLWLLYHLKQTEHYYIIIIHCHQYVRSSELPLFFSQRGLFSASARCKTHCKLAMLWSLTSCYCWLNHHRNSLELPAQLPPTGEMVKMPVPTPLLHCNCACIDLTFHCSESLGFQT